MDQALQTAPPALDTIAGLQFLARAGELLGASLDYAKTLRQVADLAVPALADLCVVDVLEDGAPHRLAFEHVLAEKCALIEQLTAEFPPVGNSPAPAATVFRTGQPDLMPVVTPEVIARRTRNARHRDLILAIGMRSHLSVPLVANGQLLGVLSLAITESDRRFGEADLLFAQELARRAAIAIDNARLHAAVQHELAQRTALEQARALSERRYRAILEQSPMSTQILAPDGRTLAVNAAWEALWGLRLEDLAAYNVFEDPQLEAKGIAPLLRRAAAGEAVELPLIQYDPDATLPDRSRNAEPRRWVSAFAYPIFDEAGAVREVVLIHQDVTGVRAAEAQLRDSEARLQRALAAGRMSVWDWDFASDVMQCADDPMSFWGRRLHHASELQPDIDPADLPAMSERVRTAINGDGHFEQEFRLRSPDGRVRWMQSLAQVERSDEGTPARMVGVTMDVTQRREMQERTLLLARAGEVLGSSLDCQDTLAQVSRLLVPEFADWCAVDLLDESDNLVRVALHHLDPGKQWLGDALFARYPPRRDASWGPWQVIRTSSVEYVPEVDDDVLATMAHDEAHLRLMRGLDIRSLLRVPLVARGETIGGLTLVFGESGRRYAPEDVTLATELGRRVAVAVDNARLHAALQASDRRKDEFLATLAHELRNPLAPLRMGLALLDAGAAPDVATQARTIMDRQLRHMVRLIDDLLDLARVSQGRIELQRTRVSLATIIDTAVEASAPLLDSASLRITRDGDAEDAVVDGDLTRLAQVVTNVLNNAAKFTPAGGEVMLSTRRQGEDVVLCIADSGIGLAPVQLEQVFEMFSRTGDRSAQGLGIGLTVSRRLVELHGGTMWAESDGIGRGSRFCVRLPIACGAIDGITAMETAERRTAPGRRILVVDDNADAAETLRLLLELDGHHVAVAGDGEDALALVDRFEPELAFLDIGLPGMSGHDLARHLRSDPRFATLPLVAVTGWGREVDREAARRAGFEQHLTKPVAPEDVRTVVWQLANCGTPSQQAVRS
jgi:signal transduction histidine kinase/PAS domain-containing protein/ActR/RegA family two-component response regulator